MALLRPIRGMVRIMHPFPGNLIIRTDASTALGSGHAMRCLALAQALIDRGGRVTFLMAPGAPAIEKRLRDQGCGVISIASRPGTEEDALEVSRSASDQDAPWVVLDGYHFGTGYQRGLKEKGLSLLVIDDCGQTANVCADILLNQNIAARESLYPGRKPGAKLLLGLRYVLLRREFLDWRDWGRAVPEVARRILVTFGGSDPANATCTVLEALSRLSFEGMEICVVIGPQNQYSDSIRSIAAASPHTVRIVSEPEDMPSLMAWADLAIASGGSTCWELGFMGVPALLMSIAGNQDMNVQALHEAGRAEQFTARNCDVQDLAERISDLIQSRALREGLSRRGREDLDGKGAVRVLTALGELSIRMRSARPDDLMMIWKWRNEPETRAVSFNPAWIPLDEHKQWFSRNLADPLSRIFIATGPDGSPLGEVRFSLQGDEAEISVILDPHYRGKGMGQYLIRSGSRNLFETTGILRIHSYIKCGNEISSKAFLSAGFRSVGTTEIKDMKALHLLFSRDDTA
jgi:UDP-2,4-diacetamido-2,4,6-trideoxy-beta-L-altropyranose hydrolase